MSQAVATKSAGEVVLPAAGTWDIDVSHSSVAFVARHLMVSKVRGRFGSLKGSIVVDGTPERSSAAVEIDASSIDTGEEKRDAHLRSPDFLDVERFPTLTFKTTSLTPTGETTFTLDGELTIKDVTRPVTLDVSFEGAGSDPWGGSRAGFSAVAEIDREDFGITWNQALETGGVVVGKKVKIELEIEAIRRQ